MKKSFIISFEGGEACGKSTQTKLFKEYLGKNNFDFLVLREPGGTEASECMRNIFLDPGLKLCSKAETLLLNASRAELIEEIVKPALNQGKLVMFDRFYDSNLVYQGYSIDKNPEELMPIIEYATGGIKPDLTILLNQSAEISYERKLIENKQDRIEQRGLDYYKKVENGYLELAKKYPERIKIVDAVGSIEEVHQRIIKVFEEAYKNN